MEKESIIEMLNESIGKKEKIEKLFTQNPNILIDYLKSMNINPKLLQMPSIRERVENTIKEYMSDSTSSGVFLEEGIVLQKNNVGANVNAKTLSFNLLGDKDGIKYITYSDNDSNKSRKTHNIYITKNLKPVIDEKTPSYHSKTFIDKYGMDEKVDKTYNDSVPALMVSLTRLPEGVVNNYSSDYPLYRMPDDNQTYLDDGNYLINENVSHPERIKENYDYLTQKYPNLKDWYKTRYTKKQLETFALSSQNNSKTLDNSHDDR